MLIAELNFFMGLTLSNIMLASAYQFIVPAVL